MGYRYFQILISFYQNKVRKVGEGLDFGSILGPSPRPTSVRILVMEFTIRVHVERLPEGLYLATSDDIQGLVAQGRTIAETLEIARDVARRLLEAQREREQAIDLPPNPEGADYTIVVGT